MATRMQQRRGTAAQWISVNSGDGPILEAGEIGFETDTGKFKIGNGTDVWVDLDYFVDANSTVDPSFGSSITFEGATSNNFETVLQITDPTADRTITFPDASGTVALTSDISELSQDAIDAALVAGTGLDKTYNDGSNTITLDIDSTVTTNSGVQTLTNKTIALGSNTVSGTLAEFNTAVTDANIASLAGTETLTNKTISYADNTITVQVSNVSDLTASAAELNTLDGITASTAELNILDGVTASAAELNILDGVTASASELNILDGATLDVTELNYLDGVTSAVQTQIDGKISASSTDTLSNKTISYTNNTITVQAANISDVTASAAELNTLDGITAGVNELNVLNGITASTAELNILDGVTASASEINILDGATLTVTELNYVDGVTSAIQTQLDDKLSKAGGTMTGDLTLAGAPTQSLHAATKAYVDGVTEGLHIHPSVKAATTTNITLASDVENGDTLDGVTLSTGDRILVKDQSTQSQNGIYVVAASGAPTRATDFDAPAEIDSGDFIFVDQGTANGNTGWVQINVVGTVGTDPIEFTQFSGAGTYLAGTGLTLTGNTFSINTGTTVDLSTAQTLTNKTISASTNTLTIAPTDLTGVTASASEINILDGATLDVNELNVLDGITASTAELNILDGVTASAAELNILDGVTASASEINILDGATLSTTELNYVDGVTSAIQTQIDGKISSSSSDTLTNKSISLGSNTVSGTIAQFNTAVTDADLATLAGTETLTNKTLNLTSNTLTGTIAQFNTALSDADFATLAGTETLTNKTLTSPVINAGMNNQTATTYTLALTDNGKVVTLNNGSAITLTVPTNASVAFPIGTQIMLVQLNSGQVTVTSSATLRSTPGAKLRTQYSSAVLVKVDTDTWVLSGDIVA